MLTRRWLPLLAVPALLLAPALGQGAGSGKKPVKKTVQVLDDYYGPDNLTVTKGSTVTWKWPEDVGDTHDVRLQKGPKGVKKFKSQEAAAAYDYKRTFTKPGTYKLFCSLHEDMVMTIKVK